MTDIRKKKIPPRAPSNFRVVVVEELLALWSFLVSHWLYVIPGLLALVVLVHLVRPLPPHTVTIATGQPNSTADIVGQQYRDYFKKHGVTLKLVPTHGAEESLRVLQAGKVDAAFTQGGLPLPDGPGHLLSLGSIAYQPLWLIYLGEERSSPDLYTFLASRKTSVNVPGSSTHGLALSVIEAHGFNTAASHNLIEMDTHDSIDALKAGEIDALFLVASIDSKNLRTLAKLPGVRLYDFKLADAYSKRFQYLDPVRLPAGAISFHPTVPANDVNMIATTLDILTTDALHPAHQLLLLEATDDYERKRLSYFSNGRFPAYMDTRIPESDVARRFFKEGSPFLWGYVPYWVASLFDELWFYILAIGAIVIPLIGFLPSSRKTHALLSIESCYDELRQIETEIAYLRQQNLPLSQTLLHRIDRLKDKVRGLWVPNGNRGVYYDLRAAINIVREDIVQGLSEPQYPEVS
jgi:NMT1-like family